MDPVLGLAEGNISGSGTLIPLERKLKWDAPTASVSARMQRQRRRDTGIELALRRELWGRGLRYVVDRSVVLPRRRHDVVFRGARVVVDVRGCFWHGCPTHGSLPVNNRLLWSGKIAANRARDSETEELLVSAG